MTDSHHLNYIKRLAQGISIFWEGNTEYSIEFIIQADLDLESAVGKHISQRLQSSLEPWLKDWRDTILSQASRPSIKIPSFPQEYVRGVIPNNDSPLETSMSCSEIARESMHEAKTSQVVNAGFEDIEEVEEILCEDIVGEFEVKTLEERLQEVIEIYKDHRLGEAIEMLGQLKKETGMDFGEDPLVREIERDYRDVQEIFEGVSDESGWIVEDAGKISIKYKNLPGTQTFILLSEAEIDVPIFNFITLMHESDLYHTWLPFCKKSKTVANLSRTHKISWQEYHVPLIATRQTCLHGFGANLLSTNGVVVFVSRSCDQKSDFKGIKLPDHSNARRAVVNLMGCIVKPLSKKKIHLTILINFDPSLTNIPNKFLSYFSRKMGKGIFKKIVEKAKSFEGSEYQKRIKIKENKEFYDFLAKTQQDYFTSLRKKV